MKISHTLAALLALGLFTTLAQAQTDSPYRTKVFIERAKLLPLVGSKARAAKERIQSIRLSGYLPGARAFRAVLNARRDFGDMPRSIYGKPDTSKVLLLRGVDNHNNPVAAAVYDDKNGVSSLHINFQSQKGKRDYSKYFSLEIKNPLAKSYNVAKASSVPSYALKSHKCESDLAQPNSSQANSAGRVSAAAQNSFPALPATYKVAQVATEADSFWFSQYGSASNSTILSIINAAEVIWERDNGVTFSVTAQDVGGLSLSSSTSAETLLYDFKDKNNSANKLKASDIYYLFSGRNFDSSIIGLSFVGVICLDNTYSYGEIQHVDDTIDYITFAHEVGHSFNATHDTSLPASVMYPSASSGQTQFSSKSKGEISAWTAAYGSFCLGSSTVADPTPDPDATPTAIPQATATPGSGGGGIDPGGDPDLPVLSMTGSMTAAGAFNLHVLTLAGTLRDTCHYSLQAGKTSKVDKFSNVQIASGIYSGLTIDFKVPYRMLHVNGLSPTIYIRSAYSCDGVGQASFSSILKINPYKIKTKSKLISKSSWFKRLLKAYASLTSS